MSEVIVKVGEKLFEFRSLVQWQNKARSWFANCAVPSSDTMCLDQRGRVCTTGMHFMRADRDGAYPIEVYSVDCDA